MNMWTIYNMCTYTKACENIISYAVKWLRNEPEQTYFIVFFFSKTTEIHRPFDKLPGPKATNEGNSYKRTKTLSLS